MERNLGSNIRGATPGELLKEWDLLRLLLAPARWEAEATPVLGSPSDTKLNAKVLLASRNVVRSQTIGNRAVRQKTRLAWDSLIIIYGGEDQLREVIESVRDMTDNNDDLKQTIQLADKYLAGWRPGNFDDDDD